MHEHRACQPTPSNHHSHARSVHLATTQPNEPQPRSICHEATETSSKAAPAPPDAKVKNKGQMEWTSRGHHAMPWENLQNPCAQGELRHARGHGAQPQRPTKWPRTRDITPCLQEHLQPPSRGQGKLRSAREHGAQSPRPWPSNQRGGRRRGGITPCPQAHLQPPSRKQGKLRSAREHGAQSPRPWPSN